MKKLLIILFFILFASPVFADIINPNLTPKQREELTEHRIRRMHIMNISRVCGPILSYPQDLDKKDVEKCKQNLKRDYEMRLKFLESYVNESRSNDNKNLEKTVKQ